MIKAALDLGSNTLRLLVARVEAGQWRALGRGLAAPRLGRGVSTGGRLAPEAKEEAARQAAEFCAQARELGAEKIVLAATQACRKAADGPDFVARLGRDLALDRAEIISGAREAALSRLGVISRLSGDPAGAVLADVGGGSSEIIDLAQPSPTPLSLALGAVSLTETHLASDPPSAAELTALDAAVSQTLEQAGLPPASRLVATAGAAAALAALLQGMQSYEPEKINNFQASRSQLEEAFARLAALPLSARRGLLALEPKRAEIILGGLAVLRGLMRRYGLPGLTLMDAGLLEGILLDF